ncbi:MAG: SDR family oxidoreductase [Firmicutes bacterium]|nr:SDR family oxidoreductase [Bacillota bacterium]
MKNVIDLSNKTILVAGASSGMGAETAILCSELGARLVLIARREDMLCEVTRKLEGEGHRYYPFDLKELHNIETFIKDVIKETGALDGMVYSAGIPGTRPLRMLKPAALSEVMNVNFSAFVELVRCVTKKNMFNNGMSIVGISSVSSMMGSLGKTAYCSSKAAMDSAVRCMAKELAPGGIRVNTVCPGIIETDMFQSFQNFAGDSGDAQTKIERQYLGLGKPIDVANAIAFLLSDASRLITGASIGVDGGMLSS